MADVPEAAPPVAGDPAARLIVAVEQAHGTDAALALSGAVFAAVWVQQRNIADEAVLAELLVEQGLPASCVQAAHTPEVQQRCEAHTQTAIDAGVFGAPSYVIDGEIFWGQDRLDFVARALA